MQASEGEGLGKLIEAILTAYEDADAEHKLQIDALEILPEDKKAPLIATQRELVEIMGTSVLQVQPTLASDAERLRAATMTVFAILNWFYMWHRPGKGISRAEYVVLATDFVVGGLRAL